MISRNKTCCFTGHRHIPLLDYFAVKFKFKKEITKLIHNGIIYFGCGGAIGFDMLAAKMILKIKKRYPHIHLILVLPCADHTLKWRGSNITEYRYIAAHADKIRVLSQNYYTGCTHVRNRYLVDNSSYCICYKRQNTGGTAYTVAYAKKNFLEIIEV